MATVGVLTTYNNPFLPGYLACLNKVGIHDLAIICDSKRLSSLQLEMILQRVGGWSAKLHYDFDPNINSPFFPFYFVESHNSAENLALIKQLGCSLLLNAGTPRRLSKYILESTQYGVLNVHPGELPHYRGKNCPEWAIFYGDIVIITAHLMTEEYDEGSVLAVKQVDWRSLASYNRFRKCIYIASFELAADATAAILRGKHRILFNSKSVEPKYPLHCAIPDDLMKTIRNKFRQGTRY
jgi:hypothetical protein